MKTVQIIFSVVVAVILAGCGGGGGSGGGEAGSGGTDAKTTSAPASTENSTATGRLFAADMTYLAIGSAANADFSKGSTVVERIIMGGSTQISASINGLAVDSARDRLYVTQETKILVFDNAGTANGNTAPRVLASSPTAHYSSPFLDQVNNRLYVVDPLAKSVYVFNNASTAINASPSRAINFPAGFVNGVAVDTTRNILYTRVNGSPCRIAVVENADTVSGVASPNRYIDFCSVNKLAIDPSRDRLYVATHMGTVAMFDNASTIQGAAPYTSIALQISGSIADIALDLPNDRLYALVYNQIHQINNISTWNGTGYVYAGSIPGAGSLAAIAIKQ